MTSKPFTIGMLGAGMIGALHIEGLQRDGRATVRWVCDAHPATVVDIQRRYEIPHGTALHYEVLADPRVDAVVIATPPFLHAPMLVDALAAGKHVLLEKPMAASRADLERIVAAAAQHPNQIVLVASCRHTRLQPKFHFVRDLIRSGRLGRVYHIHHMHLQRTTFIEWNPRGTWAHDRRRAGGGPFADQGVYDLAFHLGLLDDAPRLRGLRSFTINGLRDLSAKVGFSDIEQHGAAYMEFEPGLTYYYERGAGAHGMSGNVTQIFGTCGGLRFSFPSWDSPDIEFFYGDDVPQNEVLTVDMRGHPTNDNTALVTHFLDCLEGKAEPAMPVPLAAQHMDILFRIIDGEAAP